MPQVLRLAALHNFLWAGLLAVSPAILFEWVGSQPPDRLEFVQWAGLIVGALGMGYFVASFRPLRHWPVVLVGLVSKALALGVFLLSALRGSLAWEVGWTVLVGAGVWIAPFALILRDAARAYTSEEGLQTPSPRDRLLLRYTAQNGLTLYEQSLERPLLTVFLRHAGCTFCRESLARLAELRPRIEALGTRLAFVTMSEEPGAAKIFERYGLEDVPRVTDPNCELYRSFELRRGLWSELFAPSVWARGLKAGVVDGHGVGAPQGDTFRMPGVFLLYQGMVVKSYRHISPADQPDYLALAECEFCAPESFDGAEVGQPVAR